MLNESSYKTKLGQWNEEVAGYVDTTLENFVQSHLAIIVDELADMEKLKRKFSLIQLSKEKKRKLFIHDESVAMQIDWDKVKRRKMSMFSHVNRAMAPSDIEPIMELYAVGKTAGEDGESDDLLMVIVPGPPPNAPSSKNLETVHKKLKGVVPRMQPPKIGKVEMSSADILRRAKNRGVFTGLIEDHIVFTMQKKGPMHKEQMNHLQGGDIFFNKWPIPSIAWPQLMKVSKVVHDKMFILDEAIHATLIVDHESCEDPPTTDELALDMDYVVPFPHEHSMQLGLELINVFAADLVITTTLGSGEIFKAVLQKHKFGIGVCRTATHKKEVMKNLKAFAKLMNLISLRGAPAKDKQLILYETMLQKAAALSSVAVPPSAASSASSSDLPPPAAKADGAIQILPGNAATPKPAAIVRAIPKLASFGSSLL